MPTLGMPVWRPPAVVHANHIAASSAGNSIGRRHICTPGFATSSCVSCCCSKILGPKRQNRHHQHAPRSHGVRASHTLQCIMYGRQLRTSSLVYSPPQLQARQGSRYERPQGSSRVQYGPRAGICTYMYAARAACDCCEDAREWRPPRRAGGGGARARPKVHRFHNTSWALLRATGAGAGQAIQRLQDITIDEYES